MVKEEDYYKTIHLKRFWYGRLQETINHCKQQISQAEEEIGSLRLQVEKHEEIRRDLLNEEKKWGVRYHKVV